MKFISVTPIADYILRVKTDDQKVYDFNVLKEIERIPSYICLKDKEFFVQVKFNSHRIYWSLDCDFHIDQVLPNSNPIKI